MIITICAVILLARIKHYKLRYVFRSWSFYPILLAQCILIFFQISIFFGTYYFVRFSDIIERVVLGSFLFSIWVYHLYRPAVIGAVSIAFGSFLNNFVIAQNGGKMPVFPSLSYLTGYVTPEAFGPMDSVHILGSEATKFKILADYIDIGYSILSPGDIFVHLFAFLMLYYIVKAANIRFGNLEESVTSNM